LKLTETECNLDFSLSDVSDLALDDSIPARLFRHYKCTGQIISSRSDMAYSIVEEKLALNLRLAGGQGVPDPPRARLSGVGSDEWEHTARDFANFIILSARDVVVNTAKAVPALDSDDADKAERCHRALANLLIQGGRVNPDKLDEPDSEFADRVATADRLLIPGDEKTEVGVLTHTTSDAALYARYPFLRFVAFRLTWTPISNRRMVFNRDQFDKQLSAGKERVKEAAEKKALAEVAGSSSSVGGKRPAAAAALEQREDDTIPYEQKVRPPLL
jgi:hypothetical protein